MNPQFHARLKRFPKSDEHELKYLQVLCGRETASGQFDSGTLGNLYEILWNGSTTDPEFIQPQSKSFTGVSEDPTLGLYDLLIGTPDDLVKRLAAGTHIHVTDASGVGLDTMWKRFWVCYHDRGYRQRGDSVYEVLKRQSPNRDPGRFGPQGQSVGRRPLPESLRRHLQQRVLLPPGTKGGMATGGTGVIGARPTAPAIIQCPQCGAEQLVGAPVFDERTGIWHTVKSG